MVCHARLVVSSVGRPLEPSRRCRATSASLPSPPLLFLLLRRSFDAFRRCTLMTELFQTVADIRMNEDLVLRRRDKNPRRSRGKIASRLHRAGYTHDKTHRTTRIMRENERRGRRGGGTGTTAKSDRNAPRVAKFLTISRLDNPRLAARSTRSKYRGIATRSRHQATRTIRRKPKRVYAPVKMRLYGTPRDHSRLARHEPSSIVDVRSACNASDICPQPWERAMDESIKLQGKRNT